MIAGKKISFCTEINDNVKKIYELLDELSETYQKFESEGLSYIPFENICEIVSNCQGLVSNSEIKLWNIEEKNKENDEIKASVNSIFRQLREFGHECEELYGFINSITAKLTNNPYLLLDGEAGIGKSHILADIVSRRAASGYLSLFILGQQLTSEEPPWNQIFKRLQINITSGEFLEKLNLLAEKNGQRIVIFIDAINEGSGNSFWQDYINSFVSEIREYKWLGLVMSIRSTYKGFTIKNEQVSRNDIEELTHFGFKSVELEATNLFFDNYKIERPSTPNLNPEFKNPLFLKSLCESLSKHGLKRIPVGFHGISKILDFYVDGINKNLSSLKRYDFDYKLPLVKDSLNEIIKVQLSGDNRFVFLKEAHQAVQSVVEDHINGKNFLLALIDEGILSRGVTRSDDNVVNEVVYITYERFEDHLTVDYLLRDIKEIECLESAFEPGGKLSKYFNEDYDFYRNQGLVEALSIQLPEKYGKELYELLPDFIDNDHLAEALIKSFTWRNVASLDSKKLDHFINEKIIPFKFTLSRFLETVVSISGLDDHPYNANFIHEWLFDIPLADRDAFWTVELKYKFSEDSTFRQLIDWSWNDSDKSHISDNSIELLATMLCWFLTSTNRELRDSTTKALVSLLESRLHVLTKVMKKFDGINDPYIWERIFAVALGCVLRTRYTKELAKVAETVNDLVFSKEYVYPHILLRDYAREIIEFTLHLGYTVNKIDVSKTKPPYKSNWPTIPTKEELQNTYDKEEYWSLWSSIMGGGDFSRYVIGTNFNHSEWTGRKFGEAPVDRKALIDDFESRLSQRQLLFYKQLDPFIYKKEPDEIYTRDDVVVRSSSIVGRKNIEEITNNNQIFKTSLSRELLDFFEAEIEPYLDHNQRLIDTDMHFDLRVAERLIFSRVIELGWDPEKHKAFDRSISSGRGRNEFSQERIGKKYQWIAYHEYLAMLADNFVRYKGYGGDREEDPYQGPWEPYVRDIDPTILLKKSGWSELATDDIWWGYHEDFDWNCTFDEWVTDISTLSNPTGLIQVEDNDGEKWLVLEGYPSWKEPKLIGHEQWGTPRKEMWCHIRGYIVKSKEYETLKEWLKDKHFMGRWMPEGGDRYQLFNREYYWSSAHEFFKSDYYGCADWTSIFDKDTDQRVADVNVAAFTYSWGEEYDKSKEETLRFLKPSSIIFDSLELSNGKDEGSYIDKDGDIVCFATEALNDVKPCLLIKKSPFEKMLKQNGLEIVWTLLGEKGVIGGPLSSLHNYGRLDFSGTFFLEDGCVKGSHKVY